MESTKTNRMCCWRKLSGLLLVAVLSASLPVNALANGLSSQKGVGRALISLVKSSVSRISQVRDLSINKDTTAVGDARVAVSNICIHSVSGSYNLTASSAQPSFQLTDPQTGKTLPYSLRWITLDKVSVLKPAETITGLRSGIEENCTGYGVARLEFSIGELGYASAPDGQYVDIVTLLMQPE